MNQAMKNALILAVLLLTASCAAPPVNRDVSLPLTAMNYVEIDRYLGRWYEIARFPNSFEKDCEGVTADYAKRDDGLISVINTCRKGGVDGPAEVARGRARIVDSETNAKLKVSFFGPFWGDYWIIHVDEDYTLALVGEPKGRYLWILSRTPEISDDVRESVIGLLRKEGYNTDALYFTRQPPA